MKIGYIRRNNTEFNPQLKKFDFKEASFTRRITSRGDRIYSKMLAFPIDYEDVVSTTNMMKGTSSLIIVDEPFILNDELREKAIRWVEWANNADPKEYELFPDLH